jgi:hypothetical protein
MRTPLFIGSLSAAVVLVLACGDSTTIAGAADGGLPAPTGGADAASDGNTPLADGGTDGAVDPRVDGGTSIIPASTTSLVVTEKGGLLPPNPGSACTRMDDSFTYVLATHELSWKLCVTVSSAADAFSEGHKTLGTTEQGELTKALVALVRITKPTGCETDATVQTLDVITPSATVKYYDASNFCTSSATRQFVTGLPAVVTALRTMATQQ